MGNLRSLCFNNQEVLNQLARFMPRERVSARPLSGCAHPAHSSVQARSVRDISSTWHATRLVVMMGRKRVIAWALCRSGGAHVQVAPPSTKAILPLINFCCTQLHIIIYSIADHFTREAEHRYMYHTWIVTLESSYQLHRAEIKIPVPLGTPTLHSPFFFFSSSARGPPLWSYFGYRVPW